jgi:hypothetical protein
MRLVSLFLAGVSMMACTVASAEDYYLHSTDGQIHLHISDDGDVWGQYPKRDGRIFGHENNDGRIDGIWVQSLSDHECTEPRHGSYYWGRVKIFHHHRHHFEGLWGYCDALPDNDWDLHIVDYDR